MNKIIKVAVAFALVGYALVSEAKLTVPSLEQMPVLSPEERHETSCSRIYNYFTRAHYKIVDVNDDFAKNVIGRLMNYLDMNHSLYTQSEVDSIYAHTKSILNGINKCELDYPYSLYNENIKKRYQKYKFMIDNVSENLDLNTNETIALDRTKAPFAKTEDDLKSLWEAELKNEFETQLLNGKTKAQAVERIKNRYIVAMRRISQYSSEDVFSAFENSFAAAIDPHTNYFGPVESENFNDDI